jgi:homogentisate 1,2-dioxygenase
MTETGELAVMCDTFNPLRLSAFARGLDDGHYAYSWYEPAESDPSTAGATSHF